MSEWDFMDAGEVHRARAVMHAAWAIENLCSGFRDLHTWGVEECEFSLAAVDEHADLAVEFAERYRDVTRAAIEIRSTLLSFGWFLVHLHDGWCYREDAIPRAAEHHAEMLTEIDWSKGDRPW